MKFFVKNLLLSCLMECCPHQVTTYFQNHHLFENLLDMILNDFNSYLKKDPAAKNNPEYVAFGCTSFKAVSHYRISSWILKNFYNDFKHYAYHIFHRGKLLSGAEIHPACNIGHNFVLDHGYGTVIGETSLIGNNAYILGGVILGSRGIADNISAIRHPKIGDNVQIGSFSQILGNVFIGNNVFIGPYCVITHNILDNTKVLMKTQIQLTKLYTNKEIQNHV